MHYKRIQKLQAEHNLKDMQAKINNGFAWTLEGSVGREAMRLLKVGACMFPKKRFRNPYGQLIPSRDDLKAGTTGTFQNCVSFWTRVENGEIFLDYN